MTPQKAISVSKSLLILPPVLLFRFPFNPLRSPLNSWQEGKRHSWVRGQAGKECRGGNNCKFPVSFSSISIPLKEHVYLTNRDGWGILSCDAVFDPTVWKELSISGEGRRFTIFPILNRKGVRGQVDVKTIAKLSATYHKGEGTYTRRKRINIWRRLPGFQDESKECLHLQRKVDPSRVCPCHF